MTSIKFARILYILVGIIMPIFIGCLHTFAHFKDLLTPEVQNYLQKEIDIMGESQIMYNTWGMVSFMMGMSFITIGVLNIAIILRTGKDKSLPIFAIIGMIIYLVSVIYAGHTFKAAFQFYGGIFGSLATLLCLFLTLKSENS